MTKEQIKNLAILTLYVRSLPEDYAHFSMGWFVCNGGRDSIDDYVRAIDTNHCGTTACFAGHGPNSGILPLDKERWGDYIQRCFGSDRGRYGMEGNYSWLFSEDWPNDRSAACKRAAWLLQGREIESFDPSAKSCVSDDDEDGYDWTDSYPNGFESFTPDWALIESIAHPVN